MKRRISAMDARKRFGELLESVFYRGDEVVIERAGKPMATLISAQKYEALEEKRNRVLDLLEQAQERNKDVSYEVLEQEVERAIREVRAEYAHKKRKARKRAR